MKPVLNPAWSCAAWPLDVSKIINGTSNPNVVILPNRHNSSGSFVSDFVTDLDTRINKEILQKLVRPGDTIWLEYPSNKKLNISNCPELTGITIPENVVLRGWDDPVTVADFEHLTRLRQALRDILPTKVSKSGKKRYQISYTIKYRAALLFLRMQDYSRFGKNRELTREMLPSPSMKISVYIDRYFLFDTSIQQVLNETINRTYIVRGRRFECLTSSGRGTHWILGGNKHFVLYDNANENIELTDHPQAIQKLYSDLARQKLSAVIFEPLPLTRANVILNDPDQKKNLSESVCQAIHNFFNVNVERGVDTIPRKIECLSS